MSGVSKYITWLLRHGAGQEQLSMTPAGWVSVDDILQYVDITAAELDEIIATNEKSRFEKQDNLIRASQGHSLENMPVTQAALEASWSRYTEDQPIYHGTRMDALEEICQHGIKPMQRSHVHLSRGLTSKTGKRAMVAIMLQICPRIMRQHEQSIYYSSNDVLLARYVPPSALLGFVPMTKKARRNRLQLQQLLAEIQHP